MKPIRILLIVFFVSIIVRIPNLDRPLSKHHEFNAALVLIPIDIWNETSPSNYYYGPVMSYQNENDLYINNITFDFMERSGSYYYLSFPFLTYYIPYIAFQTGLPATPLGLQILNILLHFICAFLLFKIVLFIKPKNHSFENNNLIALFTASLYLLTPAPMWFHGNGYTHHTLVIVFLLSTLYLTLKLFNFKESIRPFFLLLFFFSLVLAMSTAWISYILALIIFIISLFKLKENKNVIRISFTVFLAGITSLTLVIWQYSSIVSFDILAQYFNNRFFSRTTIDNNSFDFFQTIFGITKWYIIGYLPVILIIIYQLIKRKSLKLKLSKNTKLFFGIAVALAFSHHILLGNFTIAHDYSVLVDGIFISVFGGIMMAEFYIQKRGNYIRYIGVGGVFVLCILQYYVINRPGEISQNGDQYNNYQKIGESIKNNSNTSDLIFTLNLNEKPAPQVIYYAKRNFYQVNDMDKVFELLKQRKAKFAKVFVIKDMKIEKIKTIINGSIQITTQKNE